MKTFGLLGYPLSHSFSKSFFTNKFNKEQINAEYLNFEIPSISEFNSILNEQNDLVGLNVTSPYKEEVIPYLDVLADSAKKIGAVNVIQIIRSNQTLKTIGHNSDIYGFYESIKPLINPQEHKKALVLGTGGASKAIVQGLLDLNIEPHLVSRTRRTNTLSYKDLTHSILREYKVIINCTPLGTYPKSNDCPDIPYTSLTHNHLLYDLVYNPETTLFMKKGMENGAKTINGLQMLHLQAKRAWDIWTS